MIEKKQKILIYIVLIIILLGAGFFMGRKTMKVKETTKIEYIKGDTIRETIIKPIPEFVQLPIDTVDIIKQCIKDGLYKELWPERVVTEYIEVTKEDTTKIMKDWATKRIYDKTLFQNDSLGVCKIKTEIQYNRLQLLDYTFEPKIKTITNTEIIVKKFSPFVGVGYLTNPWDDIRNPIITLNGGLFINEKYGIQLQYMRTLKSKNDFVGGSFIYKF